ncbi:MAG: 50S ribosomal protein L6 [Candidatus Doudnabacteria bacterium]|nr:50S ribosomal protein L6 [Candidatus Doudnabacteria bacterium]
MSRVGKKPVSLPQGVKAEKKDLTLTVTGPKGTLVLPLNPKVEVSISEKEILVDVKNKENKKEKALWGLFRALIQNLVDGVTKGFEKKLELNGVGFKMEVKKAEELKKAYQVKQADAEKKDQAGQAQTFANAVTRLGQLKGMVIDLQLGFSHPIFVQVPENLTFAIEKNVMTISGPDKQQVGQFAAEIRELKKPEPYKGKGIKYSDEVIIRKAGKVVKVVGGGK